MSNKTNETLNERIKALRKKMGFTQLELAEKLHVTDKAVSKWETGEGNPEITILIELANIFDVSVDYLLTGKEKEPEVVVMSKIELCCKNDDVEMFKTINDEAVKNVDESGKTIFDYVEQYNSKKVFAELVKKYTAVKLVTTNFRTFNNNKIINLFYKFDDVESLKSLAVFNPLGERNGRGSITIHRTIPIRSIYNEKNLVELLNSVPDDGLIIKHILTIHTNQLKNAVADWQSVYATILLYALNNNKPLLVAKLLNLIYKINEESIEACSNAKENAIANRRRDDVGRYNLLSTPPYSIRGMNYTSFTYFAVFATPIDVLNLLLEKGYIDEVIKLNKYNDMFNAKTISDGLIKAKFLEKEGKATKKEIFITSCLEYGILNIDKILDTNDYELIKECFGKYPICLQELLFKMIDGKKYKELYEFLVDNSFNTFANTLIKMGKAYDNKALKDSVKNLKEIPSYFLINERYFRNSKYYPSIIETGYYRVLDIEKAPLIKETIIKELALKIEKEKLTNGLTQNYFEELLAKSNIELLVIKLCVKLEATLKYDFHFEGTFEEMLTRFCSGFHNRSGEETAKLLNKLRKYRNGIVHAEESNETLTERELKSLIDYICKLK